MIQHLAAYAATTAVLLAVDALWLGVIARPMYQQGIGHLMAERPDLAVAALFYALYPLGLMIFAVVPNDAQHIGKVMWTGALFGFFAYATYDLTNLATLRDWPLRLSLIDVAWGSFVSALSAGAGKWAWDRLA